MPLKQNKCLRCKNKSIKHKRLKLCSACYKIKRRQDWVVNEQKRLKSNPDRAKLKKQYLRKHYQDNKVLVVKKCKDCGNTALKGSHFSQCRGCSSARRAKAKVKYQQNRKKNHLPTKIRNKLSGRLKDFLKSRNRRKDRSIIDFLGCSIEYFIKHIESQFTEGMSWDNYGEWHFDHVKPVSKFDPNDEEDLNTMSHYTNLQPLWAKDNFKKGNRYEEEKGDG